MSQQFLYLCRYPYLDLTPSTDEPLVSFHGEEGGGPPGPPPLRSAEGCSGQPPGTCRLRELLQARLQSPDAFAVSEARSAVAVAFALNGCTVCGCWCSSISSCKESWNAEDAHQNPKRPAEPPAADSDSSFSADSSSCNNGRHICIFVIDAMTRRAVCGWRLMGGSPSRDSSSALKRSARCTRCGEGPSKASSTTGLGLSCMQFAAGDAFLCLRDDVTRRFWMLDLQQEQAHYHSWWQPRDALIAAVFSVKSTAGVSGAAAEVEPAVKSLIGQPSLGKAADISHAGAPSAEGPEHELVLLHAHANEGRSDLSAAGVSQGTWTAPCSGPSCTSSGPFTLALEPLEFIDSSGNASPKSSGTCCCMRLLPPLLAVAPWTYTFTAALQQKGREPVLVSTSTGPHWQKNQLPKAPRGPPAACGRERCEQKQKQMQMQQQQQQQHRQQRESVSAAAAVCVLCRPAAAAAAAGLQQLWGCGFRFVVWPPLVGAAAAVATGVPLLAGAAAAEGPCLVGTDLAALLVRRSTAANIQAAAAAERIAVACCDGAAALQQQQQKQAQQPRRSGEAPPGEPAQPAAMPTQLASAASAADRGSYFSTAAETRALLLRSALPLSRPAASSLRLLLGQQLTLLHLRGFYRRLLQQAPQIERPLLLCPEAAAAAADGSSYCIACQSHAAAQQELVVAAHTMDDRLQVRQYTSSSSSSSSACTEVVCVVDFSKAPVVEMPAAALTALKLPSRGPSKGLVGVDSACEPSSSLLVAHCDGHGLHVLLQLHGGGWGLAWLVYRQQQQQQRQKGKPLQPQQNWSVQAAVRIPNAPCLLFAAFGREFCGTKLVALASAEGGPVLLLDWFRLLTPECLQQRQQQAAVAEITFWPPYGALILHLKHRVGGSNNNSGCGSSGAEGGSFSAAETRSARGAPLLRVLLPGWCRCGDKAACVPSMAPDGPRNKIFNLGHESYAQIWRSSWPRAADCLVRSRTHFVMRLRSSRGAPEKSSLNPLVLVPVCSPLLMGCQAFSATADQQYRAMQQRWEEAIWQQQQQQQQCKADGKVPGSGGPSGARDVAVDSTAVDPRGPTPAGSLCKETPLEGPLGLCEETDALWELPQTRVSLRDELFGCCSDTPSSSSCKTPSGEGRVVWLGGDGQWSVRALGTPALGAWVHAVASATTTQD
ncbi:uncharacterized protein LOC34618059 [Cyclospora cayetanensis]|uniref:Uncharacterized protein LOC34618059 n=1 Tax=Cyclospora cayetanensis TaxID=88456 RepID=A0A6P6RU42_9EIME|nr:uncharacterized protein LOC34618059 [Cyclospora cayetanensis]